MAKRFADSQITRENFKENDSGSDDENSGHKMASAAVMSKRKIAMPKRKMASIQAKQPEATVKPADAPAGAFNFLRNTKVSDGDSDKFAKLKALNLQFKDKIVSFIEKDPCADLTPVCKKYEAFIQPLNTEEKLQANPTEAVKTQEKPIEDEESSSDEEQDKEVKVEGPKFTINSKPPTSDSVFSFGAKLEAKKDDDDDSDSDAVEIKGPQFTFSGTVKSDVFKLPQQSKTEDNAVEPKSAPAKAASKPAFSFGTTASSEKSKDKPSFTFGNLGDSKEDKPIFTPEQQKDAKDAEKSKFDFSFGANKSTTNGVTETKKPFSLTFGTASQGSKDAVSDKPVVPSFSFGKSDNFEANKVEAKPSFSFTKPDQTQGSKAEVKPAFTFGAPNSSAAPSFTFGKPEAQKDQSKSPEAVYGAKDGFKFALPFEKKSADTGNDKKQEVVTQSVGETAENEPQEESKPIELQNGEEGETPLFSQRSKLMIFNTETKSYDSRGVGEMKLLQSKEDKSKVRFLCRSDGMGNILLNTRVLKDFTYSPLTAENENLIKVPTIKEDNKLVTYVVKFKQKADGRLFVKAIEDAKKDL